MQIGDTAHIRMEDSSDFLIGTVVKQNSSLFVIHEYGSHDLLGAFHESDFEQRNGEYYER